MLKWKVLVGLVVSILVVGIAAQAQQKNTKIVALTAADKLEIYELYVYYDRGCDEGNVPVLRRAFADDASETIRDLTSANPAGTPRRGGDNIANNLGCYDPVAGPYNVRHLTTSIMLEATPEGAKGYARLLLTTGSPAAVSVAGQPNQLRTGVWEDTFVKGPNGWRIKDRIFTFSKQGPGPVDAPPNKRQPPAAQK